jgi:hypothetical protein
VRSLSIPSYLWNQVKDSQAVEMEAAAAAVEAAVVEAEMKL